MFEKIDEIFKNIEDIRDDINILLNIAKISLIDYIMIKRGSQDMPEHLTFTMLAQSLNANFSYSNCSFHILSKYKIFFRGF